MITAIGLSTDPTMRFFLERASDLGADVKFINLNDMISESWQFVFPPGRPLDSIPNRDVIDPQSSCYCRLIDLGPVSPDKEQAWRTLVATFMSWLELCPGRIVNRPGHADHNACKPLHEAVLSGMGFAVPPSFTSSKRDALLAFTGSGRVVAKALSGQRADCRIVSAEDFEGYDERSGPVHLQRFVPGHDIRAHVIGERVFTVRVRSEAIDYRTDASVEFEPVQLPEPLCRALCSATTQMGLEFAGWDLRVDGEAYWVLEANPMPGYSYYDRRLDGQITKALIEYLQGATLGRRN